MKTGKRFFVILLLLSMLPGLWARERVEVSFASTPRLDEDYRLHVELYFTERTALVPISEVRIYYRAAGENRFLWEPLHARGVRYLAAVDFSPFQGELVEYFFDVEFADGAHQRFPDELASTARSDDDLPVFQISLQDEISSDEDVVIISPEPNEQIYTDEFILTVSFFAIRDLIDKERTRLFLDKWDVTRYVQMFDEFLTFAPRRVPPGRHTIKLELYDRVGRLLTRKTWRFTALTRKGRQVAAAPGAFQVSGQLFAELRNEELVDGQQIRRFRRSGLTLNGYTEAISLGGRVYVTNEEDPRRQPVNRYTGWFQWKFWNGRFLRLTGGDAFPQVNPFLLDNVFVRGFHGQAYLKFLNIDAVFGRTRRAIEGNQIIASDSTATIIPGTYSRKLTAFRLSFGARERFQFGLTGVKGRDEVNSIALGGNPEESAGVGADVYIATPNRRLVLEGSYNLLSYNPNILDGKDIPLDTLRDKYDLDIPQEVYDIAASLITVNQYLIPKPAIAYQGRLTLNVLNNNLSVSYKSVQDEFHSLGQPFLLRDNRGFTVIDNIRLFQNQLFLNLRYQEYKNNLTETKPATITSRTVAFNVSFFPRNNLPSFTLGLNNYQRDNGIAEASGGTSFVRPEDNNTLTVNFSSSYAVPFSGATNRITVNVLNYDRQDKISTGVDNLSRTVSVIVQTQYRIPLKTHLDFMFQQTRNTFQTGPTELQLNSFGGGLEYRLTSLLSRNDALTLSAGGQYGSVSQDNLGGVPGTDYKRTFLNGRLVYSLIPYGRLSLNVDLVKYSGDRNYQDLVFLGRYDVNF